MEKFGTNTRNFVFIVSTRSGVIGINLTGSCCKQQTLHRLLKKLKNQIHSVLILMQLMELLDVLQTFLHFHGRIHVMVSLNLMEKFGTNNRIYFIYTVWRYWH